MAAKPLLRCPSCSAKVTNRLECRNCGLLYERYFKAQAQKKAAARAKAARKARNKQIITTILLVCAVAVIGGGGWYYYKTSVSSNSTPPPETIDNRVTEQQPSPTGSNTGLIDQAKQATVIISTPWGPGTGFFVSENLLLANRHAVEYNQEQLEKDRLTFETYRDNVAKENDKLQTMKKQYEDLAAGTTRDQLEAIITDGEAQLQRALEEQRRLEQKVRDAEALMTDAVLSISLPDGSTLAIDSIQLSRTHDLALLSVSGTTQVGIALPPPDERLQQGAPVYLIGPKNISVAGTFVDFYRGENPEDYFLQLDKPISPRNSGGPLVDEKGYLRGVLTLSDAQPQGGSFAIPLDTVLNEFNL